MRNQVDGGQVVFAGQHLADLRQAIASGVEQHDLDRAAVAAAAGELVHQRHRVRHPGIDEDDLARGRRRHHRRQHALLAGASSPAAPSSSAASAE